ncbi:MAG: hypothetical protein PHT96_04790 [Syntrophorhabdaceae bacterium]|nr:hypothetical protein [Syntrophorhabdaceae bacterium]MDD4195717.1 hypothetical protein [Syntrophorhabdaceae bacterium]
MDIFGRSMKKLALASFLFLSLSTMAPTAVFSQQTDQPRKPSGARSHKLPRPRPPRQPVPFWIYESERQYQEPPTIIIRIENKTEETGEKTKEKSAEPQSTGALIIERRGDAYERIDDSSVPPKENPQEVNKITQDSGARGTCPTCKHR